MTAAWVGRGENGCKQGRRMTARREGWNMTAWVGIGEVGRQLEWRMTAGQGGVEYDRWAERVER